MGVEPQDQKAWTTAEAAFILGAPLDAFKKTLERSPVKPKVVRRSGGSVRCFAFPDLVYFHALEKLAGWVPREHRTDLYWVVSHAPLHSARDLEVGPIKFDVRPYVVFVQAKTRQLDKLSSRIVGSGAEALIKGTNVEAHRIAALLDGGMPVTEVLADYPSLKEEQVLAAKAYAEAHPKPGRPYPAKTAKAALRAADLSGLDDFLED